MSTDVAPAFDLPGYTHVHSGKVRDLYSRDATPDGELLMVASDRISAYDFVLTPTVPDKGRVLTALSLWWFDRLGGEVPNHVLGQDVPEQVAGRAVRCERLDMVPIECVARGYLAGSGTRDYDRTGEVSGIALPEGLVEADRLPEPIFTPSTKADLGEHDEPIDYDRVIAEVGADLAAELRRLTLELYARAAAIAADAGLILADTKFEFGRRADGTLVLADEVLTPDSSRFWPADDYAPGHPQHAFDKQFVRDWLTEQSGWDRTSGSPPPALPDDVVARTRGRYVEAFERLSGLSFG